MKAIVCEKCGASDFYDENGIASHETFFKVLKNQ